jgi:hypothetical protein
MSKHTPGPWIAHSAGLVLTNDRTKTIAIVDADGAQMIRHSHTDEQIAANTHLIAAAPELLAALLMAWTMLPAIAADHPSREKYNSIQDAVAKAEGGAA